MNKSNEFGFLTDFEIPKKAGLEAVIITDRTTETLTTFALLSSDLRTFSLKVLQPKKQNRNEINPRHIPVIASPSSLSF